MAAGVEDASWGGQLMKTQKRRARSRTWLGPALILVGIALLAGALYWYFRPVSHELVGGGIVSNPFEAPDFTLTDQFEHDQRFGNFRGRPIALTFVYTNCPDVCPLIAANMHAAYQRLGDDAQRVALVAVTVDPERDNVAQIRRFSVQHGLLDEWLFLTSSRAQLEAVWKAYGIYSQYVDAKGNPITPPAGAESRPSPATIEHTAPVFLIDKHFKVRALLAVDFTASDLVTDFKILLAER